MTEEHAGAWTRTSRIIKARPGVLYEAFFYPPNERSFRGKTADREDMFNVRFVELVLRAGSSKQSASSPPIRPSSAR